MNSMSPAMHAIQDLAKLPGNWNSYGAQAPAASTVARAMSCLETVREMLGPAYGEPEVQPTPDPGVALIWRGHVHTSDIEILITPTSTEWVLLKNHRIVDRGLAPDAKEFSRDILAKFVKYAV